MGTFVAIEAEAHSPAIASSAIDDAFRAIARVEALMHPVRSTSDLSAIHRAPPGTAVSVDPWTWEVLALSKRLNRASQGVFDPCLPDAAGRISDLECAAGHCVIAHAPLRIDLGGIAKGYAVDRALLAMRAAGCDGGLVNAGGDLGVYGRRSHRIVCGDHAEGRMVVQLRNAALAGSAARGAAPPAEHRGYYHGIERKSVRSGSIAVSAARAAVADALATCLLAGRGDTDAALLDTFGARLIARDMHP
jgi:thiamine biosynthesis lipoprotein